MIDNSLPEGLVTGIWENVFKVRGILVEDDNDELLLWDAIGEEK